jgi:hypothetical protein
MTTTLVTVVFNEDKTQFHIVYKKYEQVQNNEKVKYDVSFYKECYVPKKGKIVLDKVIQGKLDPNSKYCEEIIFEE